jgi:uncharacterized protein GlcG (DUF336 family)
MTMPHASITLLLSNAKRMLEAGKAKARSIGIPYNVAVVDAGGALLAFTRQDGALIGSIDLAIGKAVTARLFDTPSRPSASSRSTNTWTSAGTTRSSAAPS